MAEWDRFRVQPGTKPRLEAIDPGQRGDTELKTQADGLIRGEMEAIAAQQYLLYANATRSLLVVLQGRDASGKDGVIRHLFGCMNPMGLSVARFEEPTPIEADHDFLWRVHAHAPRKGMIGIFNRSHYEDVLVPRVHEQITRAEWKRRYRQINDFESLLVDSGTVILKFFLHISADEQLERFRVRLEDKTRQWKIAESDYTERALWDDYRRAYEGMMHHTSTRHAPWFVIPANHKWYRNLLISHAVREALEAMELKLPPPRVDLADIRERYHRLTDGTGG